MVTNNRLRTPGGYKLVGKYLPNNNGLVSTQYVDGKMQDPDGMSKDEEDYFIRCYQEGKIRNLESLEELPEDFEVISQQ